ncbi:MAG: hypothetical protein IPG63_05610 [Xanthomonadales bacterium]|nr:hypothetical protein [Xanthomonadales bacterium]
MKLLNRPNLVLFALLLVATAAQQATAATYCVATGNQLAAALTSATWNEEADEIKIEYGTLTSNAQAPRTSNGSSTGATKIITSPSAAVGARATVASPSQPTVPTPPCSMPNGQGRSSPLISPMTSTPH